MKARPIVPASGKAQGATGDARLSWYETGDEPSFTPRELEVATLLSHGHTLRSAAAALGIGHSTVRTHVKNLLFKTGSNKTTGAVVHLLRRGLIQ